MFQGGILSVIKTHGQHNCDKINTKNARNIFILKWLLYSANLLEIQERNIRVVMKAMATIDVYSLPSGNQRDPLYVINLNLVISLSYCFHFITNGCTIFFLFIGIGIITTSRIYT